MTVPAPARVDPGGLAAYTALAAATRVGAVAGGIPDVGARAELMALAAASTARHAAVRHVLAAHGTDPDAAMEPAAGPVEAVWSAVRTGSGQAVDRERAAAGVVLAHLAGGLLDDLVLGVLEGDGAAGGGTAEREDELRSAWGDDPPPDPPDAVAAAAAALGADVRARDRVALVTRRLLGEALAAAAALLGGPPPRPLVRRLKSRHGRRLAGAGLQ